MTLAWKVPMPEVSSEDLAKLLRYQVCLSDEEVTKLLVRIQPLVRVYSRLFCMQEPLDLRVSSFFWQADATREVTGLTKLGEVYTLHAFTGHHATFKPTVAEVLAIPPDVVDRVRAFELFGPKDRDDFYRQWPAIMQNYQVGLAVLYQ
jgi:hypothetical protein